MSRVAKDFGCTAGMCVHRRLVCVRVLLTRTRARRGPCLCVFPRFHWGVPPPSVLLPCSPSSPQEMTRCVSGWWISRARAAERGGAHSEHHLLRFPPTWNWESRDYFTNVSLIASNCIVLWCTCFFFLAFVSCCEKPDFWLCKHND